MLKLSSAFNVQPCLRQKMIISCFISIVGQSFQVFKTLNLLSYCNLIEVAKLFSEKLLLRSDLSNVKQTGSYLRRNHLNVKIHDLVILIVSHLLLVTLRDTALFMESCSMNLDDSLHSANYHLSWPLSWPVHCLKTQWIFELSLRLTSDSRCLQNRSTQSNITLYLQH